MAQLSDNVTVTCFAYFKAAALYSRQGNNEKAKTYYKLAIETGEGTMNDKFMAKCHGNYAELLIYDSDSDKAMKELLELVREAESENDSLLLRILSYKLGLLQYNIKNYDRSLSFFNQSLQLAEELNSKDIASTKAVFRALSSIGSVYGHLEKFDSAQVFLERALELAKEINFIYGQAFVTMNLAQIHYKSGLSEKALESAFEAQQVFEKLDAKIDVARTEDLIGRVYLELFNAPAQALPFFENAVASMKEIGILPDLISFHKNLAQCYDALSRYSQAGPVKDSILVMSERLYEENKLKATLDLEAKYESQKKELEIAQQKVTLLENEVRLRKTYLAAGLITLLLICGVLWLTVKRYRMQKDMNGALKAIALQVQKVTVSVRSPIQVDPSERLENINKSGIGFLESFQNKLPPDGAREMENILSGIKELQLLLASLPSEDLLLEEKSQKEKAIEDLRAFNYSISHDLRTPLVKIKNFVDLLQVNLTPGLSAQTHEYLAVIGRAVDQMEQMVSGLLHYARMEHTPLRISEVDTEALVKEVFELIPQLPSSAQPAKLAIEQLPVIASDHVLLQQIFLNLLSNAVKFCGEKNEPMIKVTSKAAEEETIFSVSDNGIGFPNDQRERIFGLFQRSSNSATHQGTGAGLAIAKRAVKKLKGQIWAEGKEGKGATFYFRIPNEHQTVLN